MVNGRSGRWKAKSKEDFPEIFFPGGALPDERAPVDSGRKAGFYAQALYEARLVEAEGSGVQPSDEVEMLRARLLARIRRQPGDMAMLVRSGEAVWRMLGAKHRMSPNQGRDLAAKFQAVFDSLGDQILPPDP